MTPIKDLTCPWHSDETTGATVVVKQPRRKKNHKSKKSCFSISPSLSVFQLEWSTVDTLMAARHRLILTRSVKDEAPTGARSWTTSSSLLTARLEKKALWHEPRRNVSGQSNVFNFYSHHVWWHVPTFSLSLKHPWGSYGNPKQCRFLPQSSRYLWASTLCGTSGIM